MPSSGWSELASSGGACCRARAASHQLPLISKVMYNEEMNMIKGPAGSFANSTDRDIH